MLIRIVAWPIWIVLLITYLGYIGPASHQLSDHPFGEPILRGSNQIAIEIVLGVAALIETAITLFLRRYLLRKVKKGDISIDSLKGKIRYLLIHLGNWLIAGVIVNTGIIFAIEAKHTWLTYGFFVLYICLMLFHSPRLAPFQQQIKKEID
jgi:hypothetical protein